MSTWGPFLKRFLDQTGLGETLEETAQRVVHNLIASLEAPQSNPAAASGESYDAYSVLGLHPNCRPELVDVVYRTLAKQLHPDIIGGDGAPMARINQAYQQIKESRK